MIRWAQWKNWPSAGTQTSLNKPQSKMQHLVTLCNQNLQEGWWTPGPWRHWGQHWGAEVLPENCVQAITLGWHCRTISWLWILSENVPWANGADGPTWQGLVIIEKYQNMLLIFVELKVEKDIVSCLKDAGSALAEAAKDKPSQKQVLIKMSQKGIPEKTNINKSIYNTNPQPIVFWPRLTCWWLSSWTPWPTSTLA